MGEIISALIGLVAGFLGGIWQSWFAKRNKLDEGLSEQRKLLYFELWPLTGKIPKYPRNKEFSPDDALDLMHQLRNWYFDRMGGLYMSSDTQRRYLAFQAALEAAAGLQGGVRKPWDVLYDGAQKAGSALRTGMTRDLQSRGGPHIF